MDRKKSKIIVFIMTLALVFSLLLTACGSQGTDTPAGGQKDSAQPAGSGAVSAQASGSADGSASSEAADSDSEDSDAEGTSASAVGLLPAPEIPGLTLESTMDKKYATQFDVFYYSDGYKVISVSDGRQYLIVPEGKEAPEGAEDIDNLSILYAPLDRCYLAATSAMSLIVAIDAIDHIIMSGTDASGWYIPEAKEALEDGSILYAGKYSEPDYEMLIDQDCSLAIESTMILHSPKVQEMIEKMDIPVFIDRASYEDHALGRTEWVKVYGAMFDKEEEAEAIFDEKAEVLDEMEDFPNTEKTVALFQVKTDGTVLVRNPDDYLSTMIELAGARYAFDDLDVDTSSSLVNISMEEFYSRAVDVDYLVYNSTVSGAINTTDDLLAKSELLADCKAFKEGNVWNCGNNMYQNTINDVEFLRDIHNMITDADESKMTYLSKLTEG